ncbi:type II CAAX endopeptidase family protein [Bradyrhizobium sp. Arg237L]|uniref:CPBP family intramembrane glutamic endopeptidase n=1 Tax=Bradyrhizobium sp. Arg237L TaxID=3003352 RepID=UPI00249DDD78|nr:type II CAAX endopeptidase family protein [Bradyrhizobium sp. Arg237L]MDI4239367.1 type II CAAX endopeptidase family protein [Bradyrhizobium sp. Arg237L]
MNADAAPASPGLPEVIVGLVCLSVLAIGGGVGLVRLGIDPIALGIILTALSGVGGMAGFFAAYLLRIRSWAAFGVRRISWRWIMIGAVLGVLAFFAYISFTGDSRTPQDIYATGASGGIWTVIAATFFLSVITPIGEEFLFRGVVTTALLRYGAFIGVVGGALIFAIFHGINMVFPTAVVVGLAAGEVFRRSGSIWPAVTVHFAVNLPTIPVMVLASVAK